MDNQECWLIFEPLNGHEEQINSLFAKKMGDPSAFMVLSLELAKEFGITMVERWQFNRFPLHNLLDQSSMDAQTLYCIVRVHIERPEWFTTFLSLDEAKKKLIDLGMATDAVFKSWARPSCLIKTEHESSARAESFYF